MRMISAGLAAMVFGGVTTGCNTKDLGKWDTIGFEETKKIPFAARGQETQELLIKLGRAPEGAAGADKTAKDPQATDTGVKAAPNDGADEKNAPAKAPEKATVDPAPGR